MKQSGKPGLEPYFVTFGRDETTGRVYSIESNIPGLNIEADNCDTFFDAVQDMAPDLLESDKPLKIRFEFDLDAKGAK